VLATLGAGTLAAQSLQHPRVSLMGGRASYDLSGTGTETVIGGRVDVPLNRYLLVEPAITWFRYQPQFGGPITYLFPEVGLQVQLPIDNVAPYIGGGAGRAFAPSHRWQSEWTLHAVGGMRVHARAGWGLRGELRLRGIGPFGAVTADITAGLFLALR
jgi:hypothetical protein